MKRPILILLICFAASMILSFIGLVYVADLGDRMLKQAEANAPKFMGWHESERVYLDEIKMELIYVE